MTHPAQSGDVFEHGGRRFILTIVEDTDNSPPWDNEDGHGVIETRPHVSIGRRVGPMRKRPGERVLLDTGFQTTFYDFPASIAKAREEGWGWLPYGWTVRQREGGDWVAEGGTSTAIAPTSHEAVSTLFNLHRKTMSPRQYIAAAVERDYKRLLDWVTGEWRYVGVVVTLADDDGITPRPLYRESIGGIESDDLEHFAEVAHELASQICGRVNEIEEERRHDRA